MQRLAKLTGLRPVLGVVDYDIFAADERQRVVQRLGLGARLALRHDNDLETAGQAQRVRCGDRVGIARFEDQLDVEPRRRMVEPHQRVDQGAKHVRFAVKRHENGIGRKLVVGHAARKNGIANSGGSEEDAGGE
jgi:hypothetical protein